jgi:hypothetical protein
MRSTLVRLAGSSFLAGCLWTCWLQGQPADRLIAITADRLIDATGNPTINDAVIVVEEGRIAAVGSREAVDIPEGAELIELGDQTLLPGMINSGGHIEFRGRKQGRLVPQFDDPPYQKAGNLASAVLCRPSSTIRLIKMPETWSGISGLIFSRESRRFASTAMSASLRSG